MFAPWPKPRNPPCSAFSLRPRPGIKVLEDIRDPLNQTFAGTLVTGQVAGQVTDILVAGNDAKTTLVEPVQAGGEVSAWDRSRARQLEGLGFLGIQLQFTQGTNFASAWKFFT